MKLRGAFAVAVLSMAGSCFAQNRAALCPRHIEPPVYPQLAHTAHITGTVVLHVTISADGSVIGAVPATTSKSNKILDESAIANVRLWTFAKPPTAPYVETITYVYRLDSALMPEGGPSNLPAVTRVSFDLPDHVEVRTNVQMVDP